MTPPLPSIPAKRYFTIGEVAELCGVKTHVLRYWEQEFTQLRPIKRRGNRRYYQHHEVLMVRRIRGLLYEEGFTISGARNRLQDIAQDARTGGAEPVQASFEAMPDPGLGPGAQAQRASHHELTVYEQLMEIRKLLSDHEDEARALTL